MILREIQGEAEAQRAARAAQADGHACIAPTHVLVNRFEEIRGCFSLGRIDTAFFWSHTGNSKFDSVKFGKQTIALARLRSRPAAYLCTHNSPFSVLMPGFGFELIGEANLWRLKP